MAGALHGPMRLFIQKLGPGRASDGRLVADHFGPSLDLGMWALNSAMFAHTGRTKARWARASQRSCLERRDSTTWKTQG
jgi:hypothetical protein